MEVGKVFTLPQEQVAFMVGTRVRVLVPPGNYKILHRDEKHFIFGHAEDLGANDIRPSYYLPIEEFYELADEAEWEEPRW